MATVINGSGDSTFNGNIIQLDSSPEYHFATDSATHYNWRIAAQEQVNGGFEIASGTQTAGSNASSDTYTNRLVIDSAGRVTMPYQPYFYAKAGAQRNSVSGVLTYSNTVHNIGNHYNGTNRFTAPVAGVYFFKAQAYKEGTSAGTLRLRVNGVNVEEDGRQIGGTTTHSSVITVSAYKLNAGDYVEILTDYPSHQNADYSVFTGFLLG